MISCDEVFDVLTRGPFPTGRPSDGVVEAHLGNCAECQRLAAALRPAVELFEAVAPQESRNLPSYGGRVRASAAPLPWEATLAEALPVVSKPELNHSKIPERQNWSAAFLSGSCPVNLARFAAAAVLGAVIAGAAFQWAGPYLQFLTKGESHKSLRAGRNVEIRGVKLYLPWTCQSNSIAQAQSGLPKEEPAATDPLPLQLAGIENVATHLKTEYHEKFCCTKCHKSERDVEMSDSTSLVIQHCAICHTSKRSVAN